MQAVKWGILSTAEIGLKKVIPAMMQSVACEVCAIASRDPEKAKSAANELGIAKSYGSYEQLLADPEIEAIYNPLPNHLHVPVSIKALQAGKHVLCEKPIALSVAELDQLIEVWKKSDRMILEAYMVRHHPQWQRARVLLTLGAIGEPRLVQSTFSYFNADPSNIRNQAASGGGALYDIGVYPIIAARYFFGREPVRVFGLTDRDPRFGTDVLTSALLDFAGGHGAFTVSTQMVPYQRLQLLGSKGRIEIEVPYNAPPHTVTSLYLDDGSQLADGSAVSETFAICDQYKLQAETFGRIIRGTEQPEFDLTDSRAQMRVVDALFQSAQTGAWADI